METESTFNQKRYINKYNKETYNMIPFRVKKSNHEVMEKLKSVSSMNKYIVSLIENDIHPNILTIKQIKERILPILKSHGIDEVYLFGSYSRGEATVDSDVDIYCNSGDIRTLVDQGFLEDELVESLGKPIDIIFTDNQLSDYFKEQLEKDRIKLC